MTMRMLSYSYGTRSLRAGQRARRRPLLAIPIPLSVTDNDTVPGLPKVVSPLRSVGQRGDVDLVLVSVEAWPDDVVVRMRGRPSPLTHQMEGAFETATEKWHDDGAVGLPPAQPAEQILDVNPHLTDDAGTEYRLRSAARGGTGTEFHANWTFVPGPPANATLLAVHLNGEVAAEVDLASV